LKTFISPTLEAEAGKIVNRARRSRPSRGDELPADHLRHASHLLEICGARGGDVDNAIRDAVKSAEPVDRTPFRPTFAPLTYRRLGNGAPST
jgi:hypothetical protein